MHEVALAQSLLNIVCQAAEENQFTKVLKIKVVYGELVAVVPGALEFGFQVSSEGTLAQGAQLEIEELPALIECSSCGHRYSWQKHGYICNGCSGGEGELVQGQECFIEYIEGEEREVAQ